jgi:hypothetical protein
MVKKTFKTRFEIGTKFSWHDEYAFTPVVISISKDTEPGTMMELINRRFRFVANSNKNGSDAFEDPILIVAGSAPEHQRIRQASALLAKPAPRLRDVFDKRTRKQVKKFRKGKPIRVEDIEVKDSEPIKCEIESINSKFNCGIRLLAHSRKNVISLLTEDEARYIGSKRFIRLGFLCKIASRLNITMKLISPQGKLLMSTPETDRNYPAVYGLVVNNHIYNLSFDFYNAITAKSINVKDLSEGINNRDMADFLPEILDNFKINNVLPLYVKHDGPRIVQYIDDKQRLNIALPDHETYQEIIDMWNSPPLELFKMFKTVTPSPETIAYKLVQLLNIPLEHIYEGPIYNIYKNHNLEPIYYGCPCESP